MYVRIESGQIMLNFFFLAGRHPQSWCRHLSELRRVEVIPRADVQLAAGRQGSSARIMFRHGKKHMFYMEVRIVTIVHVCKYIYMYVYLYVHIYTYLSISLYIYTYIFSSKHIQTDINIYTTHPCILPQSLNDFSPSMVESNGWVERSTNLRLSWVELPPRHMI